MFYKLENTAALPWEQIEEMLRGFIEDRPEWKSVLLLPPDITRFHSGAGKITAFLYRELTAHGVQVMVLPALGTHVPMTRSEQLRMFGDGIPEEVYLVHDFRNSITEIGTVPADVMEKISNGLFTDEVRVSVNRSAASMMPCCRSDRSFPMRSPEWPATPRTSWSAAAAEK